jgi:hypothetical protein
MKARKKTWTVIALRENGQIWSCPQKAHDQHEAMRLSAVEMASEPDMEIVCAIAGDHEVFCPCEDSGKSAWVADLLPDKCTQCGADMADNVVGCPDGSEICRDCFNAGAH